MEIKRNSRKMIWIGYIVIVLALGPSLIFFMVNYMQELKSDDLRAVNSQRIEVPYSQNK